MTDLAVRIIVGAIAAIGIGVAAHRAGSLSASGAAAAAITGTAAAAAGYSWAALLIIYFVSSSLLSRLGRRRKLELTATTIAKAGPRDAVQVLANGLPFAVAAVAEALAPGQTPMLMAAGAGSLAASAADTWATEVGTLVGQTPRSILTGRRLAVGASGGVTLAGSAASLAGAALIASTVALSPGWTAALLAYPVFLAGIAGSLTDSLAGALLQRRSWCDACGKATEMRVHSCGAATRHVGGISFIENDAVNLLATIVGALAAMWAGRPWPG